MYSKWKSFIEDPIYYEYFLSYEEIWINNLNMIKQYIDKNNIKPLFSSKDISIKKMANWINIQLYNFKVRKDGMKKDIIRQLWIEFINSDKYKKYF